MANDLNVVVLNGRLTRDCELKATTGGTSVCRFSIAVNRRKKTGDSWGDEVNYFDVVLWGRSAESLQSYLTKGRQVSIEGELRQSRWEQDGVQRSRVEVYANNVQLLSTPGASDVPNKDFPSSPAPKANTNANTNASEFVSGPEAFEDRDIPF